MSNDEALTAVDTIIKKCELPPIKPVVTLVLAILSGLQKVDYAGVGVPTPNAATQIKQQLEQNPQSTCGRFRIAISKNVPWDQLPTPPATPQSKLFDSYQDYINVQGCHKIREGYAVVWVNDVEMERARHAI